MYSMFDIRGFGARGA